MKRIDKRIYFTFLIVAIFVVIIGSLSTSFLYPFYEGADSPIFKTIGKYWANGVLPYEGLFDHKGPLIFFIDMLGYKITGNTIGIVCIQIVFMFFTLIGIFLITCLFTDNKKKSIFFTLLTTAALFFSYQEGNLTEEYVLPLLAISLYGQIKHLKNDNAEDHTIGWACFYGITVASCALTRLTNALPICCGILCILIDLSMHKKWKNILWNGLAFIVGGGLLFVPFVIYFMYQGIFSDFIYGTFVFNLAYSSNTVPWWKENLSLRNIFIFLIVFFPTYCSVFSSILALKRKKCKLAIFYMLMSVTQLFLFLNSHLYGHYVMICIPQFSVLLCEIDCYKKDIISKILISILTSYSILAILKFGINWPHWHEYSQTIFAEYKPLMESIPKDDTFISYNGDTNVYLWFDREPCYKYFILQDFQSNYNQSYEKDMLNTFSTCKADWILVTGKNVKIQNILNENYILFDSINDNYFLYKIE